MKGKEYRAQMKPLHVELLKLQRWVAKTGTKVLAIFEGRDAAGKGGAIKRITKHLNPRGCRVVALGKPTDAERGQWYFQRYVSHLPSPGEIVLFDRSWYNRAGLERVMGYCSPDQAEEFLESVPEFEAALVRSGIVFFKLYFDVSREEQARRLAKRRTDPLKQWKVTPLDLEAQHRWADYTKAEAEMFRRTSTKSCPWIRVDADDKRAARVNVIRWILRALPYDDRKDKLLEIDGDIMTPVKSVKGREAA